MLKASIRLYYVGLASLRCTRDTLIIKGSPRYSTLVSCAYSVESQSKVKHVSNSVLNQEETDSKLQFNFYLFLIFIFYFLRRVVRLGLSLVFELE